MKNISPFFSIVVPIYNVEKYLEECLLSIQRQTISEFEVILVNDGSSDKSKAICEKFVKEDSRFRLINQENMGLFKARCNGLREVQGQYIVHVDSDDSCQADLLENLVRLIERHKADLIIYNCNLIDENSKWIETRKAIFDDESVFSGIKAKQIILEKMLETSELNNIWIKCAHKDIISLDIDNEYNYRIMMGEDVVHSIPLINAAYTMVYSNKPLYNYRVNSKGMSRSIKVEYLFDFTRARYCFFECLRENKFTSDYQLFFSRYIWAASNYLMKISMLVENKKSYKEIYEKFELSLIHQEYKKFKSLIPLKQKMVFSICHPRYFIFIKVVSRLYYGS